jgi:hypothetical protein
MNHLSIFREIESDLLSMVVKYEDDSLIALFLYKFPGHHNIKP